MEDLLYDLEKDIQIINLNIYKKRKMPIQVRNMQPPGGITGNQDQCLVCIKPQQEWTWWHTPFSALGKQRQMDLCEFNDNLVDIVNSWQARATQ